MWSYNDVNELYHHGVKGMKWGVRKAEVKGTEAYIQGNRRERRNILRTEKLINTRANVADRAEARAGAETNYVRKHRTATEYYKRGLEQYNKVSADYRNAKATAMVDKTFKNDPAYKAAVKAHTRQVINDLMYSQSGVYGGAAMKYASDAYNKDFKAERQAGNYSTKEQKRASNYAWV